jgi:hypothetical protein
LWGRNCTKSPKVHTKAPVPTGIFQIRLANERKSLNNEIVWYIVVDSSFVLYCHLQATIKRYLFPRLFQFFEFEISTFFPMNQPRFDSFLTSHASQGVEKRWIQ